MMNEKLQEMFDCLQKNGGVYLPSLFWQDLNERNIRQLDTEGLGNIKRTVAQNYFTWVVGIRNDQFRFLASKMSWRNWLEIFRDLPSYTKDTGLGRIRFLELCVFTRMLWLFAEHSDHRGFLKGISEPEFGNPFPVNFRGRLISQDLINAILEIYSVLESVNLPENEKFSVCELGAGYGRNAYAFLKAFPGCKYIIVDIPPALYVSQEYLATVFPEKKIMRFHNFRDADEVKSEFDAADIVCLLPHQSEIIADKSIDLFVNISSLHEMTHEQISAYFSLINRVTRGHFYLKQWKSFFNPTDNITVTESSYPYPESWRKLWTRTARVQPAFFEAIYAV